MRPPRNRAPPPGKELRPGVPLTVKKAIFDGRPEPRPNDGADACANIVTHARPVSASDRVADPDSDRASDPVPHTDD